MANKKTPLYQAYANESMLSSEAFCLSDYYISKLQRDIKQRQFEALVRDISNTETHRRFYPVEINAVNYWADAITGTLYNNDGICMTSSVRRLIGEPTPIQENAILDRLAA